MSNVYKLDNLEDLLQCVICLDRFQIPKVLTCQHTFCLRCLESNFIDPNLHVIRFSFSIGIYDSHHQTLTWYDSKLNSKNGTLYFRYSLVQHVES